MPAIHLRKLIAALVRKLQQRDTHR